MNSLPPFPVPGDLAGATLAAVLRSKLPGVSWNAVRALVAARRVQVLGEPCLDDARRLKEGDTVELLARPLPPPSQAETIPIRYLDEHLIVVEKPSGLCSVRHPSERVWSYQRQGRTPTLEELLPPRIGQLEKTRGPYPPLRIVQRLDKETSGLVVFARSLTAERELGRQFFAHTVHRRYLAVVPGAVGKRVLRSHLLRDRGDGRRGSAAVEGEGKLTITHVEPAEELPGYTVLRCRLETGRTHQIRIHLAELGNPICGERVYIHRLDGGVFPDRSNAPRLALHAQELGFQHPVTMQEMHWTMPLPADLRAFIDRLRAGAR